jgi:dipeptide transport system substrate-binding protein
MAAFLVSVLLIAGCHSKKSASVKDNVLVYCSEGSPQTFNPQLSTSGTTFDASSRQLYNRLVEFEAGSTFFEPALATHWDISPDGRVYTFYLRKDVHFHHNAQFTPSRPFSADDVIFSLQRQWLKNHPYHQVSNLSFGYFDAMELGSLIESIEKINDYEVKIHLRRADGPFLATMAMDFSSILSAEYGETLLSLGKPEQIDTHPIGTGPFQLVRYQPDAYIRYKAHDTYWQGKPKLENLVFAITPDPSLRFARTIAGECDVMANPLPVHIDVAYQQSNMQVLSEPGLNIAFLSMNTLKPPFNNRDVRIAINHAINKQAIINAVYQNTATIAKNPIPPSMWSYDQAVADYDYNPERARRMLDEAGYADGFDMSIWTMSAQRSYNPNAKKMAELIQQDLKNIGVTVEISTYEFGTFLAKTRNGEHHAALMGWTSDNGDPDNFFTPLLSCSATLSGTNSAFWCDPAFSRLVHEARSQSDIRKRQQIYHQVQRAFKLASPWVPIAHATQHIIINPRVQNFEIYPSGGVHFMDVSLAPKASGSKSDD